MSKSDTIAKIRPDGTVVEVLADGDAPACAYLHVIASDPEGVARALHGGPLFAMR